MEERKKHLVVKPLIWGFVGSLSLFGVYFLILTILNSVVHAWQQYKIFWLWMSTLILGFGVQVGMFAYLRGYKKVQLFSGASTSTVIATGGVSTGSMVACCLHHATDVLPILGLSAATIFLSKYQTFFLGIGVISNLVGITFMLSTIQKHHLFLQGGFLEKINMFNMKKAMYLTIIGGTFFLFLLFFWT